MLAALFDNAFAIFASAPRTRYADAVGHSSPRISVHSLAESFESARGRYQHLRREQGTPMLECTPR